MSSLTFTLGGKVDPSLKASLNQAASEAEAAGLRIQNALKRQITGLEKSMKGMDPTGAEYAKSMLNREGLQRNLLMAQNATFLAAAKSRIAVREAEAVAAQAAEAKIAEAAVKSAGHIAGLNLVIRESIVMLREWGRGNYARMPGSASLVAQGLAQMGATGKAIAFLNKPLFQAEGAAAGRAAATGIIGALASIPLAAMALVAGSLAAIIGAPFLYFHRVKKLAGELATTIASTFKPEHIARYLSKLEILNQLQLDVADSTRKIQEAHDSVGDSIQREMDLTKDRISFERELLEIQKTNALAAVKNPAEREAIEKKFSTLLLKNRKEERDAELEAMKKQAQELPAEMMAKKYEIAKLTSGGYVGKDRDAEILLKRQTDADEAAKLAENDPALILKLQQQKKTHTAAAGPWSFLEADQAKLDAAQARVKNATATKKALNEWKDTENARDRERARVEALQNKVKADAEALAKLNGTNGNNGAIAAKLRQNLQDDSQDLKLANERLKRVDAGRPLSGREVTERERVGFGSPQIALLDVNRSMDRKLGVLVQHAQRSGAGGVGSFGTGTPNGFGD